MGRPKGRFEARDVSLLVQKIREFLLGRKHTLHGRFPLESSTRTIPQPDIPRAPDYKYSEQYYFTRSPVRAITPPIVAPIGEGPPVNQDPLKKSGPGGMKPDTLCFSCAPTPGLPWWWDGHCYYK